MDSGPAPAAANTAHPSRGLHVSSTLAYERTIDSHLARLRRKIEDDPREPRFLETVRGLGYRFVRAGG